MTMELIEGLRGMSLTKEEENGIMISADQRENAAEDCLLSLFRRLLSKKSRNRRAVHDVLRRAWRMGPDMRIIDVGLDIFQFKFPTEAQRDWVYDNGSWIFENDILLLHRWQEGLNVANICFTHL